MKAKHEESPEEALHKIWILNYLLCILCMCQNLKVEIFHQISQNFLHLSCKFDILQRINLGNSCRTLFRHTTDYQTRRETDRDLDSQIAERSRPGSWKDESRDGDSRFRFTSAVCICSTWPYQILSSRFPFTFASGVTRHWHMPESADTYHHGK